MKNTENYLRSLLKRTLNETFDSKAEEMKEKIKKMETTEGFDSPEIKHSRGGKDFDKDEFKTYRFRPYEFEKDYDLDSITKDKYKFEKDFEEVEDENLDALFNDENEPLMEGEMCEQCGGGLSEGECMECGYRQMNEETYDLNPENEFDYTAEEYELGEEEEYDSEDKEFGIGPDVSDNDVIRGYCSEDSPKYNKDACRAVKGSVNERLYGKQRKLDKNKNGKIDADDFKLLKKGKSAVEEEEVEEGNLFSGKRKEAIKQGKKSFKVDGKTYPVKESIEYHIKDSEGDIIKLSENEMVNLIENIVNEQKIQGLKTIGKPKGLTTYEKAHKGSGKENQDYLKSVNKKMKDYLKDGSKGKFDMNPKMFPMGNGELAKMDKKAFKMTDELEDFNYEIAGQNFPVPDAIDYNEEWMEKLFNGDSMTGNAPGGNALESKTNDRFNKMRKKNTLKKLKDQSYKRVPQPVYNEKSGTDQGKGLNIKLESLEPKKTNQLNEEFDRIKQLLGYDRKTQ